MSFKRINNITGWAVCIFACIVYLLTMEATGSFWDCGEFASSAYKLQIPHPPGAPLFILLGRLFMIPFSSPDSAILGLNSMSALMSGFTILFLFWSITHFARKIVEKDSPDGVLTGNQIFSIMAAGAVGALAYTFSDSFWYSAVESEVYASSSFFTAIVFWLVLKWEQEVSIEELNGIKGHFTRADRWLILIFYMVGLAVGVHLLPILTIPAIVMVYYFKRYKATGWKTVWAFMIACVITGIVQVPMIQWSIKFAGQFDIFFKNDLGLPFFFGFTFFFVMLGVAIFFMLRLANKKNWNFLKLAMWSFAFVLLGFSTYYTTLIRSNADPAVDMFNVDNPVSLVGYLSREQYGDWPILYGQDFTAGNTADNPYRPDYKTTSYMVKGKSKYEDLGKKQTATYHDEDLHFFPRMWDNSNDQGHADYYASFAGIEKDKNTGVYSNKPTIGDNFSFFFSYQFNWMYWRYFMWNFAGKQNDIQGVDMGNVRDGNWLTGIPFWDNARLGDQSKMPDSIKHNKSHNTLFCLPLILGILGLIYQYKKDKQDTFIVGLLFFFTGMAIVVYLNQAGDQPRERDYAYVGSFYAFAIWIGLSVLYIKEMASQWNKKFIAEILIGSAVIFGISIALAIVQQITGNGSEAKVFFVGGAVITALFLLVAAGLPYVLQFIQDKKVISYVSAGVCMLAVPVIMGIQEWDDHDRSHKVLARDLATDYLQSCAPNAILITFGDNDTYPLWYAQEVQGIRRDVRVINSSLMGTDWYLNQLRYKVNLSDPIDVLWTPDQIIGSNRDAIYAPEALYGSGPAGQGMINSYRQKAGITTPADQPMDLYTMMKDYAGSDDPNRMVQNDDESLNIFPTKKVKVPVDTNLVRQNGTVNAGDSVVSELDFDIPKNFLGKNESAILNIIAANKWKRPIYFTSPYDELGFGQYLRMDGLTYRLVPVKNSEVNPDWAYDVMTKKFVFGNADKPGVYYDEENRRHLNNIRQAYAQVALSFAETNRKDSAKKLLEKCDKMMLQENFPYGLVSRREQQDQISGIFLQAAYLAGDTVLAKKVSELLRKDLEQQVIYFNSLDENKQAALDYENRVVQQLLQRLQGLEQYFKNPASINPETGNPIINNIPKPKREKQVNDKTQ